MGAVENQRRVYHRSHRPWKSLQDFHTPAVLRLLIDKRSENGPKCHPINRLPSCLSLGVQSNMSGLRLSESRRRDCGKVKIPRFGRDFQARWESPKDFSTERLFHSLPPPVSLRFWHA